MKKSPDTKIGAETGVKTDASVVRGPQSWDYIYNVLGFAITIEGIIVSMFPYFPYNLIAFIIIAAITFYLFIFNGRFQNKLITMKQAYEDKAR